MSFFYPKTLADFCTSSTGYLVDFSNTFSVIMRKKLADYTAEQLLTRAFIGATTITATAIARYLESILVGSDGYFSPALSMAIGLVIGLIAGHIPIIAKKVMYRRNIMQRVEVLTTACELLKDNLVATLPQDNQELIKQQIEGLIKRVNYISLQDDLKSPKAIYVLFSREKSLNALMEKLSQQMQTNNKQQMIDFWSQGNDSLFKIFAGEFINNSSTTNLAAN